MRRPRGSGGGCTCCYFNTNEFPSHIQHLSPCFWIFFSTVLDNRIYPLCLLINARRWDTSGGMDFFLMACSGRFLMLLTWNVMATAGTEQPGSRMKGEEQSFGRHLNVSGRNTLLDRCFIARALTVPSLVRPWKPNESNDLGLHLTGCLSSLPSSSISSAVPFLPFIPSIFHPPPPTRRVFRRAPHTLLNTITAHS